MVLLHVFCCNRQSFSSFMFFSIPSFRRPSARPPLPRPSGQPVTNAHSLRESFSGYASATAGQGGAGNLIRSNNADNTQDTKARVHESLGRVDTGVSKCLSPEQQSSLSGNRGGRSRELTDEQRRAARERSLQRERERRAGLSPLRTQLKEQGDAM